MSRIEKRVENRRQSEKDARIVRESGITMLYRCREEDKEIMG